MADDLQSKAAEMMKKVLTVGVGALFLTEESLRAMVTEFKLPKELLGGIFESANKTKKEFLQNLSKDVLSRVTDKMDPVAFLEEFLHKNEVELHIKVGFKPRAKESNEANEAKESKDSKSTSSGRTSTDDGADDELG